MGDFNCDVSQSPSVTLWKAQGWVDIQEWAFHHQGRQITMTSKHSNVLDHVFVSPELACYLREVDSWQLFADHSCIGARLDLPVCNVTQSVWTMPAYIPYDKVDMHGWHQSAHQYAQATSGTIDEQFQYWCQDFESSFTDNIDLPGKRLTPAMVGRGQRTQPEIRAQQCPILRPSRPGEVHQSSELLGRTVHKWFLQLRRMQSMLHALKAGKQTWDAQIYRMELWKAITFAKGYEGSFKHWWSCRPIVCQGSPDSWPTRVPTVSEMKAIFYDYETNYRAFETWHAQQRQAALQLSLQENTSKIFAMVKPGAKAPLQHLETHQDVLILAVSDDLQQVHVDRDIPLDQFCDVEVDGLHVNVTQCDGPVWSLSQPLEDSAISAATITRHFATATQIHEHLADFWSHRWWKSPPSASDWTRIFEFSQVYLPAHPEHHEPITSPQWHDINQRYGTKSARGPDGFSRRDLQWMPQPLQDRLVQQLNRWEQEGRFPDVLCTGFAHPLPKRLSSHKVNDFRPVIIFSMIYRSWSSLRARQLLRQLQVSVGDHQFGFLSQKENTEIWMVLQACIEDSSLADEPLAGFVSDIEKAFECLPRAPVLWLAQRLGVSRRIIQLWSYFLESMARRFHVSNEVGPPLHSNTGFPEGCGLSCVAMTLVNIVFHKYMQVYAKTTSLSFVDNLELLSRGSFILHAGIQTMHAWADMWRLRLDAAKSYVWANNATLRAECQTLGWEVKTHAKDLGAPMTYGTKHSVVDQVERMASLKPLWILLRRLSCSSWDKKRILCQAFWPRAYYGSAICCMSWTHTKQLRTEAMKALRLYRGGANPGIRLAVLNPPSTDPGYFQFWQVLLTFRRIARKQPGFVHLWHSFMHKYQGKPTYGPFGKLLEVCGQVGWQVVPPNLIDHDGVTLNLLQTDLKQLEDTAIDAWRQAVAYTFAQRKDVSGLAGVDWRVIHAIFQRLPHYRREALHVLQDGTFIEHRVHKKYDNSKTGHCRHCGAEDTMQHRCTSCPALQSFYAKYQDLVSRWDSMQPAFSLRLLPSRNPYEAQYKLLQAHAQPRCLKLLTLRNCRHLDLFTDGSCWTPELPWASVGAWAVVSATHDKVVAKGTLTGLRQTSDEAELQAIVMAIEFAICNNGTTTIWTDSAFAAEGLHRLLCDIEDQPEGRYNDVWEKLQHQLCGHTHRISVQHIPAHRSVGASCLDVEDWTAHWNDRVDHEAAAAHSIRDPQIETVRLQMLQHFHACCADLRRLVDFHSDLAEYYFTTQTEQANVEEDTILDQDHEGLDGQRLALQHDPWQRGLPEATPLDWRVSQLADRFGWTFTQSMLIWLQGCASGEAVVAYQMSYLELAIHIGSGQVTPNLPLPDEKRRLCWVDSHMLPAAAVSRPTVSAILCLIQNFFAGLDQIFDFGLQFANRLDLASFGVLTPQKGVTVLISCDTVKTIGLQLKAFTMKRPVRRSGDLTRPVR